jgi:hypothetical protein
LSKSDLAIPVKTDKEWERDIIVNRYVVQKGLDHDAVRLNRTDAALVPARQVFAVLEPA